jgi:hypothetical protein
MQYDEKRLTEEESLMLISKTIHEAKSYYYESGLLPLVYGFSVLICSLLQYMIEVKSIAFPFSPFYLLIPVFFLQALLQWKESKKTKARTFTNEVVEYIWVGFFLASFTAMSARFAGLDYVSISILLILMGFAALLSGIVSKFTLQAVSGFLCWVLAVLSFFMLNADIYLLLATASVLIWIVPGFIMRTNLKK